jgi:predicted transcriptional regulator
MKIRAVSDHRVPPNLAETRKEDRHRMTLDALADVEAKRTVTHVEVEAWAKRLGRAKRTRR